MAQKKATIKVELNTAVALAAYEAWSAARQAKEEAEEAMDAAAAILAPLFEEAGATVATIGGRSVLRRVASSRKTFDSQILFKLAPKAAAKAQRVSEFSYIRKA